MQAGEALRAGRRAIDGVCGVEIQRDLAWDQKRHHFRLLIRIHIDPRFAGRFVPSSTDWCVVVDPRYPFGEIKVYPAKRKGIKSTFPHQSRNDLVRGMPFRSGNLCLDTPLHNIMGMRLPMAEPLDAHWRLAWHIHRAKAWVEAAARGELLSPDDHYELPAFPQKTGNKDTRRIVFSASETDLQPFLETKVDVGVALLAEFSSHHEHRLVVMEWRDIDGRTFARHHWGQAIAELPAMQRAAWLLLPAAPILPPWQAPSTWGELRQAIAAHGAGIDERLQRISNRFPEDESFFLLIGFPIPGRMGEPARELHWQPIEMPALVAKAKRAETRRLRFVLPGFRDNALGRRYFVRHGRFAGKLKLAWRASENWHSSRIGARGRLAMELCSSKIAIIGVGALGSCIAELLVRMGVRGLALIDGETLDVGNLARHRLGLDALGGAKASELMVNLNLASPHAEVKAHPFELPWDASEICKLLDPYDVIVDCTAEDTVLKALGTCTFDHSKLFASISLGLSGRRLYFYTTRSANFPFVDFRIQTGPWIDDDNRKTANDPLTWEGAGCWHPLSSTRYDDIFLFGATAMKLLEAAAKSPKALPRLQVFERSKDDKDSVAGVFSAQLESAA